MTLPTEPDPKPEPPPKEVFADWLSTYRNLSDYLTLVLTMGRTHPVLVASTPRPCLADLRALAGLLDEMLVAGQAHSVAAPDDEHIKQSIRYRAQAIRQGAIERMARQSEPTNNEPAPMTAGYL